MPVKLACLFVLGLCLTSCDGSGGQSSDAANPYENAGRQNRAPSPAPPAKPVDGGARSPSAPPVPLRRQSTGGNKPPQQSSKPPSKPKPSISVPDVGDLAVPLTFAEYSRMTRRASEMLEELTKIHIAVDESADASPYQDRWGQLTADLSRLYRDALGTGYPPEEVAKQLNDKALPLLKSALDQALTTMQQFTSVESGIDQCYAEALAIYEHMHHALAAPE